MATQPSLMQLATQYRDLTQALTKTKDSLLVEQVLACLVSRDRLARLWADGQVEPDVATLIDQGDRQLRSLTGALGRLTELKEWRENFNPPPEAWWWQGQPPIGWLQRFDWLATALALIFLTLAAGLITDIAPRFLSGGPDARGAMLVVAQTAIVLLTTGSVLTQAGREAGQRILNSLHIPKYCWQEIAAGVGLFIFIGVFILRQSLPEIAVVYNDEGLTNYCAGQLTSARFAYERALKLNPDYLKAHYNLGQLYEDLQDFEQAKTHYQVAVQGGLEVANNSLARLYILDENYTAAVPLLLTAQQKVDRGEITAKLVHCQRSQVGVGKVEPLPATALQYEVYKNLGWARLGQKRYEEAEPYLQMAIDLNSEDAPAYCLRAQVLEGLDDSKAALADWKNCLKLASSNKPEEDTWIGMARQRF